MFQKKGIKIKDKKVVKEVKISELMNISEVMIPIGKADEVELLVKSGQNVSIGTLLSIPRANTALKSFSSMSGKIEDIIIDADDNIFVKINSDFQNSVDEKCTKYSEKLSSEQVIDIMKETALVGFGGAIFPTYLKYIKNDQVDTIIINDVECEPHLRSDEALTIYNSEAIIKGAHYMLVAAQAEQVYIAVKKDNSQLINALKEASKLYNNINVKPVGNYYPSGWEEELIREVLNRKYNNIPIECGVIVNNAYTAAALAETIETGIPTYYRLVTVAGDAINKPQVLKVRIGTPIKEILSSFSEIKNKYEDLMVIMGGPMMGQQIDINDVVDQKTNGLLIYYRNDILDNSNASQCIKCGACVDVCPVGIQPINIIRTARKAKKYNMEKLDPKSCIGCGACTYACPAQIPVREIVLKAAGRNHGEI